MRTWAIWALEDDVRHSMFECMSAGTPFALATITAANGGPRPVGSQMLITMEHQFGYLSGGCIESDVALNGRGVIGSGEPRRLVYGAGSPFIDMRLPCGGRIEVAVERVAPDDQALADLRTLTAQRQPALWISDGVHRQCQPALGPVLTPSASVVARRYLPTQRLVVIGQDAYALAIADAGVVAGWETILITPLGPTAPPPIPVHYDRRPITAAIPALALDRWTAVAVATHDMDADEETLKLCLPSQAGYIGVLGSRRKLAERLARLRRAGITAQQLQRLRAPIGLPIGARSPRETAFAIVSEIIAEMTGASVLSSERSEHVARL